MVSSAWDGKRWIEVPESVIPMPPYCENSSSFFSGEIVTHYESSNESISFTLASGTEKIINNQLEQK